MEAFMMTRDKHGHSVLTRTRISQILLNRYINVFCFMEAVSTSTKQVLFSNY